MAYSPTLTKLRFSILSGLAESGNGTIGYTYSGGGNANGADQSIGTGQEGGIECVIGASGSVAFLGLSKTNGSQDQSSWDYGIQFNGTSYAVIIDGANGNPVNAIGQTFSATLGDTIRLRKVGLAYAVIVAEVKPVGTSDWVVVWLFSRAPTTTLYPALQTYGGSDVMGPMILQIGQAQARVADNTFNLVSDGDSLEVDPFTSLQTMAPFLGTGTTFSAQAVSGRTFSTMNANVANVTGAHVAGKTNLLEFNGGTNDSGQDGSSNATIKTNMTTYVSSVNAKTWFHKVWRGTIPRAAATVIVDQTTRDTENVKLVALDALIAGSLGAIGVNGWVDLRLSTRPYNSTNFSAWLQANFEQPAVPPWQETWALDIHYTLYRGAWLVATYMSDYWTSLLDVPVSDGALIGIQGPMFARRAPQTQGGFTSPFATHTSTGALVVGSATIAGTAAHRTLHTTTGALAVQSATMSGAAQHQHATTGALVVGSATIAGTAAHTSFGTHATSGALAVQSATMAGTAAHLTLHTSTGALVVGSATMAGQAAHQHASTGALVVGSATMAGTSVHTAAGTHPTIGVLAVGNALISATAQLTPNPNASFQYAYWLGQHRKRRWQLEEAARQERELLEQAQAEEQAIEQAIQEAPTKKSAMVARSKLNDNRLAQAKITILAKEIEKQIRAEADEADDVEVIQLFEAHRQAQIHAIMELLH